MHLFGSEHVFISDLRPYNLIKVHQPCWSLLFIILNSPYEVAMPNSNRE